MIRKSYFGSLICKECENKKTMYTDILVIHFHGCTVYVTQWTTRVPRVSGDTKPKSFLGVNIHNKVISFKINFILAMPKKVYQISNNLEYTSVNQLLIQRPLLCHLVLAHCIQIDNIWLYLYISLVNQISIPLLQMKNIPTSSHRSQMLHN